MRLDMREKSPQILKMISIISIILLVGCLPKSKLMPVSAPQGTPTVLSKPQIAPTVTPTPNSISSMTPDITAPTKGSAITSTSITSSSLTLNWGVATDAVTAPASLQYKVVRSASNNITTVANANANGVLILDWSVAAVTCAVTGLTASTSYYFAVLVKDAAGNAAIYTPILATTLVTTAFVLEIFNRSSAAIEYGFDLMETFDDIQDWQGSQRLGQAEKGIMSSDYPKRIDGSNTPLNVYDYWVSTDPGDDFIKDHRVNGGKIWDPKNTGVGKSLCMDLSHRGDNGLGNGKNWGPSRFGTYFGSLDGVTGDHTHGYREMYVFFMVYISKNQWPTRIDTTVSPNMGYYVEGDPYTFFASWKFMTMGQGFKEPWVHSQGPGSGNVPEYANAKSTYGWYPNVVHYKPHGGLPELKYGDISDYIGTQTNPEAPCITESHGLQPTGFTNISSPADQWIGVEIRYTLNTPGKDDGSEQMWWYEADGTEHPIAPLTALWLQSTCSFNRGDKMNLFFIGGNNSATYLWGNSMEPRYYVDDFIIHGSRIGPTYFSKKLGENPG